MPPYNSFEPRWSPDGSQLAYSHRGPEDASAGMYVAAADGSDPRLITTPPEDGYDGFFAWSPDGTQIAYTRTRSPFSALYVVDVASGEEHALTDYTNNLHPDWSPDGARIVFTTSRDGFQELYSARPDGSDLLRLTHTDNLNDLRGQWSPDGTLIAYMTNYAVGDHSAEIHVMHADGSASRQITNNAYDDQAPRWSPDGRYLVFTTHYLDPDNVDLTVYDLHTDTLRRVTDDPAHDTNPHWSPDSAWIAFESRREGGEGIYLVRPDGSDAHPLSSEEAYAGPGRSPGCLDRPRIRPSTGPDSGYNGNSRPPTARNHVRAAACSQERHGWTPIPNRCKPWTPRSMPSSGPAPLASRSRSTP